MGMWKRNICMAVSQAEFSLATFQELPVTAGVLKLLVITIEVLLYLAYLSLF